MFLKERDGSVPKPQLRYRSIAEPALGHFRHLHPRRHRVSKRAQQLILMAPLIALERRGLYRPPLGDVARPWPVSIDSAMIS